MARPQGTSPRTQRLIALAATCAIAIATAFAFGRVYAGHGSTWRLMFVGLLSAAVACALERRNLLLATLVSLAVLAVVIGFFVFPGTTWHGLPTLETLRRAAEASRMIGEQARVQVAPTAPLRPLLLAGFVAMWAAIFSCHALAFRASSPLLALLPPIALLAFADTVLEELTKPVYGVAFLAAALLVVFADALRRVQGWGPVWVGPGARARLSATASRGARRVAAATVAVAALVPILVPGFGSKAIIDINASSKGDLVRIDPLVSVGAALNRTDPVEVFQVTSNVASYWRMLSLPTFDGQTWRPDYSSPGAEVTPETTLVSAPPGSETIDQVFRVSTGFADPPGLPVAYPPEHIDLSGTALRYDPETGTASFDGNLDADTVYHARSVAVEPTPAQLAAVVFPTAAQNARYTALPDDPTIDQIKLIAEAWTADATTDYQKVVEIQDHLNDTRVFTYDKTVPRRDDSYTLVDFLTRYRHGFCQQFASAMGVMLRTLGIPARLAEGFTAGEYDPTTNVYHVSTDDAHVWVEVLFPTYGWLAFEPTPGRTNPIAVDYQHPSIACAAGAGGCGAPDGAGGSAGAGGATGSAGTLPQRLINIINRLNRGSGTPGRGGRNHGGTLLPTGASGVRRGRAIVLVLLGLALLIAVLVPPIRAVRRRVRLRRAGQSPRRLILVTYDVFTERAADLGFPRGPGETLEEYRRRITRTGGLTDGRLDRLTAITGRAAYSAAEPEEEDARQATEAAARTIRDLRGRAGVARRIVGQYRMRDRG